MFEDAAFALQPGERSGIVTSPIGYHIIQLKERREAGVMDLEEARPLITRTLRAYLEHEALRVETMRLRESADIRRVEEAPQANVAGPGSNAAAG